MADDDTFFGIGDGKNERTVLKPRPGGRSRSAPPGNPGSQPGPAAVPGALAKVSTADRNVLTAAATPLLSLAGHLSTTASHNDPQGLFQHIVREVQAFEASVRQAGVSNETALTARYALCTLIDEMVLNTPWGSQSAWSEQTLLTLFHKEAWGGEKYFQILNRAMQQPAVHLDLLELLYLCLSMGLQGKYRVQADGRAMVEGLRANLYQTLRTHRGEVDADLAPAWRGVEDVRSPLRRAIPLWAVAAIGASIAMAIYLGFLWSLNRASDPVAIEIASLGQNLPPLVERTGYVAPVAQVTLKDLMQPEIAAGTAEVTAAPGSQTITLRALFRSGSAEVGEVGKTLLEAVTVALSELPGTVVIAGHTDDVPTRTIRFPSNWHLSKARAEGVRQYLASGLDPSRLSAEPRADSEPLVPNDNAQNRSTNRRVEITLFNAPGRE